MLLDFVENFKRAGRGVVTIVGLDKLRARSHADASMRISAPIWAQERSQALTALARISLTFVDARAVGFARRARTHQPHARRADSGPGRTPREPGDPPRRKGSRPSRPKSIKEWVRTALTHDETFPASNRDLEWTSLSRTARTGAPPADLEKLSLDRARISSPFLDPFNRG